MNQASAEVDGMIAQLTRAGAPFELTQVKLGGRRLRAYRNAPTTLAELINAGRVHGAKEFMAYQDDHWSFDRFFAAVDALAGRLQGEAGLQPGDRVAIAMRNRPEWAVAFAAAVLVGAVPAPLNSFGQRNELVEAINDVGPRVLFCDADRCKRLEADLQGLGCHVVLTDAEPAAGSGVLSLRALIAPGGPKPKPVTLKPDDPALLLFTSGASSRPKGVLSAQRAVCQALVNIDFIGALSGLTSPVSVAALMARGLMPTTLSAVPLFHVSGLHAQLLTSLRNGKRLVFMHRWDPTQALQMIRDEKITQFNGAPAMVMQLMATPGFDPANSARTLGGVGFGGAGLPQRLIDDVLSRFADSMSGIGFGLTETNGVGAAISGRLFAGRPRSSGLKSPIVELRIAGPSGEAQPAGEAGEIWVRGVTVMKGYWRQPEATAQALKDGWFRTGDIGYIDNEGFLFVVDRIKDVINRSGEKIAAAEVESCLLQHPLVAEAAVIARPDDTHGEVPVAIVVPQPGATLRAADVVAHVAARLASYKVPAEVIVRSDALPRNPAGKLLKGDLKRLYVV
jgi:long-chain acyl-CoA synthetase